MTEKPETTPKRKAPVPEEDNIVTLLNIFQDAMSSAADTADTSRNLGHLAFFFRKAANFAEKAREIRQEMLEKIEKLSHRQP